MFIPPVAVGELMLRSAIVYVFVFVLLRMLGKKHVGEMAPFDLVILLILGWRAARPGSPRHRGSGGDARTGKFSMW